MELDPPWCNQAAQRTLIPWVPGSNPGGGARLLRFAAQERKLRLKLRFTLATNDLTVEVQDLPRAPKPE